MSKLDEIKRPIDEHLTAFEKKFRSSMKSSVPLLNIITSYIIRRKGKQMRPMFVFLSAEVSGGVKEATYTAASLIELLHTATLVHDDVVDDSNMRRGFFSINALWKNKVAVLVGDFLLAKGLLLALDNNEFDLLRIVSDATREMSEGELLQIEKSRKLDVNEEIYFEIIRKKTASLIASCCAAGASSAGATTGLTSRMKLFGEKVGIAFQIKDDLFDYDNSEKTGKPNGIDIKEKKMTLPLIYLLNNTSWAEKRKIIHIIRNHNTNPEKVKYVIDRVNESGGIDYSRKKMEAYHQQALDILSELDESEAKISLIKLVNYTIERNR
jgi:octaprenyl-diphosphate synthase